MNTRFWHLIVCTIPLILASVALAGEPVEIRLGDGSRWRGEVGDVVAVEYRQGSATFEFEGRLVKATDLYIMLETRERGKTRKATIFRSDLVSIESAGGGATTSSGATASGAATAGGGATAITGGDKAATSSTSTKGVFILPLEGPVGVNIRHNEIKKLGEHADKFGENQIIILRINTDGGSAPESEEIAETIFDIRKRHRVIAWIEKAISAGCQTAMCCNEIYFMTEGTAGSVTTWNPGSGTSIKGEDLRRSMEHLAEVAERGGRSKYIAYAMKTNSAECSYDKDPVTGDVTFYDDTSGEFLLSDDDSNLCFNSSNAEHCGFSDGTADTYEELAELLDLGEWREVDGFGRKIAEDWNKTVEKAQREIPRLAARLNYYKSGGGDQIEILGARIKIMQDLLKWCDRCPPVAPYDKEALRRQIAEMKKQLADMRRQQRDGR